MEMTEREREREREFVLKIEDMFVETGKSELCGRGQQAGNSGKSESHSLEFGVCKAP